MRVHALSALMLALLGVMIAGPVVAQPAPPQTPADTTPPPPWGRTNIDNESWENIQRHMESLVREMDTSPWVSDWQTLVWKRGNGPKEAKWAARVSPRRRIQNNSISQLERGRFIGMIEQTEAPHVMPELGIFPGKTFVWVDKNGPGSEGSWRAILFPLISSLASVLTSTDSRSFDVLPGDTISVNDLLLGAFGGVDGGLRPVFRCQLGMIDIAGLAQEGHLRAYWGRIPGDALGLRASLETYETSACYTCDRRVCCPVDAKRDTWR